MSRKKTAFSWKTSTGGAIAFCALILVLLKLWNSYLTGQPIDTDTLFAGIISLATAISGFSARDNNVTSEEVGIQP